jgi:hypothetical protein
LHFPRHLDSTLEIGLCQFELVNLEPQFPTPHQSELPSAWRVASLREALGKHWGSTRMIFSHKGSLAREPMYTSQDGWAYIVNGATSDSFSTAEALEAARHAAVEQR